MNEKNQTPFEIKRIYIIYLYIVVIASDEFLYSEQRNLKITTSKEHNKVNK